MSRPGRRRAATSCMPARRTCAPAGLCVHTPRRPRPSAGRGSLLPMCRAPRLLGVLPGRAHAMDPAVPARCVPRTASPSATPAVRAPAEAAVPRSHLRSHALVIATGPPIFKPCVVPLLAPSPPPAAPTAPPPVNSPPRPSPVRLTFLAYSLGTLV
jgi:hypothetical protein